MTITQLVYFISVANEGSLTKTAASFHVSQPAVSSAIRDLENEFNLQLFTRSHRKIELTDAGIRFYKKAVKLVNHYHMFQKEIMEEGHAPQPFILAMTTNLAPLYLPGLYSHLRQQMPDAVLDFREDLISNIMNLLKNDMIDVACMAYSFTPAEDNLYREQILTSNVELCIHKKLITFDSDRPSIPELADIPFASYYSNTTHSKTMHAKFAEHNLKPNIVMEAGQLKTLEEIIKHGVAASFLPKAFFADCPDVLTFPLDGIGNNPIYLIWKHPTDHVRTLVRHIKAYFRPIGHM